MWIVPRDVAFWFGELLIRPRGGTEIHAEQLFNQAFQRGFGVSSEGIAKLDDSICCFVFAPDDADDAAANFVEPPLTMKVRQEFKTAQEPGSVLWWLAGRLSSKRARSQALQYFGHDLDRRSGTANAGLRIVKCAHFPLVAPWRTRAANFPKFLLSEPNVRDERFCRLALLGVAAQELRLLNARVFGVVEVVRLPSGLIGKDPGCARAGPATA